MVILSICIFCNKKKKYQKRKEEVSFHFIKIQKVELILLQDKIILLKIFDDVGLKIIFSKFYSAEGQWKMIDGIP